MSRGFAKNYAYKIKNFFLSKKEDRKNETVKRMPVSRKERCVKPLGLFHGYLSERYSCSCVTRLIASCARRRSFPASPAPALAGAFCFLFRLAKGLSGILSADRVQFTLFFSRYVFMKFSINFKKYIDKSFFWVYSIVVGRFLLWSYD